MSESNNPEGIDDSYIALLHEYYPNVPISELKQRVQESRRKIIAFINGEITDEELLADPPEAISQILEEVSQRATTIQQKLNALPRSQ